jgi:hypothetical protein
MTTKNVALREVKKLTQALKFVLKVRSNGNILFTNAFLKLTDSDFQILPLC